MTLGYVLSLYGNLNETRFSGISLPFQNRVLACPSQDVHTRGRAPVRRATAGRARARAPAGAVAAAHADAIHVDLLERDGRTAY